MEEGNMKKLVDYLTVRSGFLIALVVLLNGLAFGQSGDSKDVARTTAPNAAIDSTNNSVGIANSPSDPSVVKVVKDPAVKRPFQVRVTVLPVGLGFSSQFLAIPAGKRFVIENVSALGRCPEGLRMEVNFFSYLDNNGDGVTDSEDLTFHRIVLTDQGTFDGTAISSANHKVLVFADGQIGPYPLGIHLQARLNGTATGSAQAQVTFSGYLEDLPAVP